MVPSPLRNRTALIGWTCLVPGRNSPAADRVDRQIGREATMPDDLTNKGPQDRSRISLLEPHEVQYWADKFGVSKERLSEAVRNELA